jgi:hypothetical protein
MKTVSQDLKDHLAGEVTTLATCWKVTRTDGVVMGFTDHDKDIVYDSLTYKASSGFSPSAVQSKADLSVSNLDLIALLDDEDITKADIEAGVYDYAEIHIFMINYENQSQGILKLRRGWLGEVTMKDLSFQAEMRGLTQALRQRIGRVYTPTCDADLGDSRCQLQMNPSEWQAETEYTAMTPHDDASGDIVKPSVYSGLWFKCVSAGTSGTEEPTWPETIGGQVADGTVTWEAIQARVVEGEVTSLDSNRTFYDSGRTEADDYFSYGKIVWTSGNNNGYQMEIKGYTLSNGQIVLFLAMPKPIQVGDTFEAYAGCDGLKNTCKNKFDNYYNYQGFPDVPGTDEMLRTPNAH